MWGYLIKKNYIGSSFKNGLKSLVKMLTMKHGEINEKRIRKKIRAFCGSVAEMEIIQPSELVW